MNRFMLVQPRARFVATFARWTTLTTPFEGDFCRRKKADEFYEILTGTNFQRERSFSRGFAGFSSSRRTIDFHSRYTSTLLSRRTSRNKGMKIVRWPVQLLVSSFLGSKFALGGELPGNVGAFARRISTMLRVEVFLEGKVLTGKRNSHSVTILIIKPFNH